jgi:O-antigen/teichoic acid export membrane protein
MAGGNTIIKNTIILYIRMFISLVIGFISTRIVLNVLGVNDFGIFNLIAGVVGMLSFFSSAMAGTTQRFLSYSKGSGNNIELKKYFETSIIIHLSLGLLIILLLEIIGPGFIRNQLLIPESRLHTALLLFQFVIISAFFTIIAVPFDGSLSANEDFTFIAFSELFISISKLGSALLLFISGADKLLTYGILICGTTIIVSGWKQLYCINKYSECKLSFSNPDKGKFKEMLSFAGWNLFGSTASIARGQGIAVIMNLFFGVVVNAAYGVANQVSGQLQSFSSIISKTIYPQLTQAEGGGNRDRMFKLSILTSKMSYLLLSVISVPAMIEMGFLLKIWLRNVPENSVIFTNLSIGLLLISSLSNGLIAAVQSIGKIRLYQSVAGSLLILGLPVAYLTFKLGGHAYYAIMIAIIFEIITHIFRLIFLKHTAGFQMREFLVNVDLKLFLITLLSFFGGYFLTRLIGNEIARLLTVTAISSTIIFVGGYFFISNIEERERINYLYISIKGRFHKTR